MPATIDTSPASRSLGSVNQRLDLIARLCNTASPPAYPFLHAVFASAKLLIDSFLDRPDLAPSLLALAEQARISFLNRLDSLLFCFDDALPQAPESTRLAHSEAALALARLLLLLLPPPDPRRAIASSFPSPSPLASSPPLAAHLTAAAQRERAKPVRLVLSAALDLLAKRD